LGLFPSLLREVPKSGGWLQTVKVTTAFAELGLALAYFAKADLVWDVGVLTRNVMIAVWVAVLSFMSLYLLGLFRLKDDTPPPHLGVARILCAMFFGISAIYLGFGAKTAGVFDTVLPAYIETTTDQSGGAKKHDVYLNLDQALAEARRVNKPVFVEFTGAT
ncbi:MAG TPA: cytochrome C biogenesis protein, partial [Planctomycetota bacterium]|nr:cytochrome C biogenesis protein [Planctomycetota bacterium]